MTKKTSVYEFQKMIVREPARSVIHGLRDGEGANPTYAGVKAEHDRYLAVLRRLGINLTVLPAVEEFPDSIFVEDPALVFKQGAIILRAGAQSRHGETALMKPVLEQHFDKVLTLPGNGLVDGGDILNTPKGVMIGLSARTNQEGAEALQECLEKLGLEGRIVNTPAGVLHFKTDCAMLDDQRVLSTKRLAASGVFHEFEVVNVPEREEAAANALRVNEIVMVGSQFPKTISVLESLDYKVVPVPTSEIGKIDAGLSCMSLRW